MRPIILALFLAGCQTPAAKDLEIVKLEIQNLRQRVGQLEAEVALINASPPK